MRDIFCAYQLPGAGSRRSQRPENTELAEESLKSDFSRYSRVPSGQRYERGSTLVTSNLPFQKWTEVLGSERLTGALLDQLTDHVNIIEMNGDSYRLKQSRRKRPHPPSAERYPSERASG